MRQPAGTGTVNNYWNYLNVAPSEAAAVSSGGAARRPRPARPAYVTFSVRVVDFDWAWPAASVAETTIR